MNNRGANSSAKSNSYQGRVEAAEKVSPDPSIQARVQEAGRSLLAMVSAARNGDAQIRNRLICMYQPYIMKVAATVSRRYLRPGLDDEIVVAMMGFNEAVDCYNFGAKVPFLSFAEVVIRRRLVDFFRSQSGHNREIPLSCFESEGEDDRESQPLRVFVREAEAAHASWEESIERREEILRLRTILAEYGLTFAGLARVTPKHRDTRQRLIEVGAAVAGNDRLMAAVRRRRGLPIQETANLVDLSRKTIERHRKYILALALILTNDLPHLRSYLLG